MWRAKNYNYNEVGSAKESSPNEFVKNKKTKYYLTQEHCVDRQSNDVVTGNGHFHIFCMQNI